MLRERLIRLADVGVGGRPFRQASFYSWYFQFSNQNEANASGIEDRDAFTPFRIRDCRISVCDNFQ
jgi:hypothetical protein